jgi:hypothetical protein
MLSYKTLGLNLVSVAMNLRFVLDNVVDHNCVANLGGRQEGVRIRGLVFDSGRILPSAIFIANHTLQLSTLQGEVIEVQLGALRRGNRNQSQTRVVTRVICVWDLDIVVASRLYNVKVILVLIYNVLLLSRGIERSREVTGNQRWVIGQRLSDDIADFFTGSPTNGELSNSWLRLGSATNKLVSGESRVADRKKTLRHAVHESFAIVINNCTHGDTNHRGGI